MTLIGGRDVTDGTQFHSELAVIGAGPAGIVAALEATRRGVDVIVIETGNRRQSQCYQELSSANIADPRLHAPIELAVSRQIGGTSSIWGGRCVPYDPIDFLPRSVTPGSTWPVTYEETEGYFARACEWFKCGRAVFNVEDLAHLPTRMIPGLVGGQVLDSTLERWSLPTNFGEVYYQNLVEASNLRVITDATCVRINLDDDNDNVGDITCKTLSGTSFTVAADQFIVASGGLEGTRLLMCSPGRHGRSIGDHSGHLGHWYMAHLEGVVSDLVLSTPAGDTVHSYERDLDGSYVRRRLTFTTDFLVEHDLPNIAGWIANPELPDASHRNAQLSLAYLILVSPLGRFIAPPAQRLSLTGVKIPGAPYGMAERSSVWAHLRNLLRHPVDAVRFVYEFGAKRLLSRGRKPPGFFVANAANRYPLQYHAEHLPNYESSVRLSSDTDEFGMPRLEIDISFSEDDIEGVINAHKHWDDYLRTTGLGRIEYLSDDVEAAVRARTGGGFHQVGTTRMAKNPTDGVVDEHLKVHGVGNLHVASSSVFVTSGQANSTFMVVVFALRLVDRLYGGLQAAAEHPARKESRSA